MVQRLIYPLVVVKKKQSEWGGKASRWCISGGCGKRVRSNYLRERGKVVYECSVCGQEYTSSQMGVRRQRRSVRISKK